ncbi:MAG: hypothetical protein WD278_02455, partial [Pirellulales bacterium]
GRLADEFRRDAAAARAVVPIEAARAAAGLGFSRPDGGTVEYRGEPGGLMRRTALAGSSPSREMFRLTERAQPVFAVEESDGITVAVLSFEGDAGSAWRLEAIVGRDLRFVEGLDGNGVQGEAE